MSDFKDSAAKIAEKTTAMSDTEDPLRDSPQKVMIKELWKINTTIQLLVILSLVIVPSDFMCKHYLYIFYFLLLVAVYALYRLLTLATEEVERELSAESEDRFVKWWRYWNCFCAVFMCLCVSWCWFWVLYMIAKVPECHKTE